MGSKHFVFYNRNYQTVEIVTTDFFNEENGFNEDDTAEVKNLKIAESIILGMDDSIVTRVFED